MEKVNHIVSVREKKSGKEILAWQLNTDEEVEEKIKEVKNWKCLKEYSIVYYTETIITKIIKTY